MLPLKPRITTLVNNASARLARFICAYISGCVWVDDGGRPCPKGWSDCGQPVYRCIRCGDYTYGDEGDLSWQECFEECRRLDVSEAVDAGEEE